MIQVVVVVVVVVVGAFFGAGYTFGAFAILVGYAIGTNLKAAFRHWHTRLEPSTASELLC